MLKMNWLNSQIGTLDNGIEQINQLYWFLNIIENTSKNGWTVTTGESVILKADSKESVDAFVYGMALAYSIIPEEDFDNIVTEIKKAIE